MITRFYPYTLTLNADAILQLNEGNPNTVETLSFIPGSVLRGITASKLGDPSKGNGDITGFRSLILDGTVCYLNAYPFYNGFRGLPVPLSWRTHKATKFAPDESVTVKDLAALDDYEALSDNLGPLSASYVTLSAGTPRFVNTLAVGRVHHQRDRAKGRAWTDAEEKTHGAIFTMESLSEGQVFGGLLKISGASEEVCESIYQEIQKVLQPPLLIGKSRHSGYGGDACIEWGNVSQRELDINLAFDDELAANSILRIILTSAYVGRNPDTGQYDPIHFFTELNSQLDDALICEKEFLAYTVVGSFNKKWKLETPQAQALASGSVLVCKTTKPLSKAQLLQIEHQGIGERQTEGFGRFAFFEGPQNKITIRTQAKPQPAQRPEIEASEEIKEAEGRVLMKALEPKIADFAANLAKSANNIPTNSLIGRLRGVLRHNPSTALDTLSKWLGRDERRALKRTAMDQLEKCRFKGGKRLLKFLQDYTNNESRQKRLNKDLQLDLLQQNYHLTTMENAKVFYRNNSTQITIKLLDALLSALAVKNRR